MRRLLISNILFGLLILSPNFSYGQWVQTNGPFGLGITALASDVKTLFFCTNPADSTQSGVYRSTDGGSSWQNVSTGLLTSNKFNNIAVHDSLVVAASYSAIFVSTNLGQEWYASKVVPQTYTVVTSILITDSVLFLGTDKGLLRSLDSGKSWGTVNSGLSTSGQLFVSTLFNTDSLILISTGTGIYGSTNFGAHWQLMNEGLPSQGNYISSFAALDGIIYAATTADNLYRSIDHGKSWASYTNGFPPGGAFQVLSLATFDSSVFAALQGRGIYRLENGTWTPNNINLADLNTMMIVATDSAIFAGTSAEGIEKRAHGTLIWEQSNTGLPSSSSSINGLVNVGQRLFAEKNGFMSYSDDAGGQWTDLSIHSVTSFLNLGSFLLAARSDSGIFRSNDNANTWESLNNSSLDLPINQLVAGNGMLFATEEGGTYRSLDSGKNWVIIDSNSIFSSFAAIASSIYTSQEHNISRSTDGGITWMALTTPQWVKPSADIVQSTQLASNDSNLFASTNDYSQQGTPISQLYRTSDNGTTWVNINGGFPPIDAIVSLPPFLLVSAEGWVFASTNSGTDWISLGKPVENITVNCFGLDATNLYAGTAGKGVWKIGISDINKLSVQNFGQKSPTSISVYPNPTVTNATLAITAASPLSDVQIELYDAIGRHIQTQYVGALDIGDHHIALQLPEGSGIRLIRVFSSGEVIGSVEVIVE